MIYCRAPEDWIKGEIPESDALAAGVPVVGAVGEVALAAVASLAVLVSAALAEQPRRTMAKVQRARIGRRSDIGILCGELIGT